MIIATATERDLPELLELECLGFAEQERWSAAAWRGELVAEHRLVLVIREGTGVSAVACFGTLAETAELLRIVVHPSRARQGLARRLVAQGQEWAEACGAERMLLEVRYDNAAALGLYQEAGFVPIARRAGYYGAGREAVVMEGRLRRAEPALAGWAS